MNIQQELFNPDLIYGRQSGQFLSLSPEGISLSQARPQGPLRLDAYITSSQEVLSRSLQGRSFEELTTLATNLSYAVEKRKQEHVSLFGGIINNIYFVSYSMIFCCFSDTVAKCIIVIYIAEITTRLFWQHCSTSDRGGAAKNHEAIANLVFDNMIEAWADDQDKRDKPFVLMPETLAGELAAGGYERANADRMGHRLLCCTRRRTLKERLAFRRMLDARRTMQKEGYFVVTHGQGVMGGVMVDLMTALTQKLKPRSQLQDFKVLRLSLRSPQRWDNNRNLQEFFQQHIPSPWMDIGLSSQLLSVSINPWDQSIFESALYFWWNNGNMGQNFAGILQKSLSEQVTMKPEGNLKIKQAFERLREIVSAADRSSGTLGQLYAIGIPGNLVENNCPLYPAFPFGMPDCRKSAQIAHRLNTVWSEDSPCQGRVLTSMLLPGSQIKVHAFNTHSPELHRQLDQAIQEAAEEIVFHIAKI